MTGPTDFTDARLRAARLGMALTLEHGVLWTYYLLHIPGSQGDVFIDLSALTRFLCQAERTDLTYAPPRTPSPDIPSPPFTTALTAPRRSP
jgi:hypothetical protein